jgi:hypothetical protein
LPATQSIARNLSSAFGLLLVFIVLSAQTPALPSQPTLNEILQNHIRALKGLHLREPHTEETSGTLEGLGATGVFHEWQQGVNQRRDERLGFRTQSVLRVGDKLWIENANGEIRQIEGIVARRQLTQDFVDSGDFAHEPQYVHYIAKQTLRDGRMVYELRVEPPQGEAYVVGIDTNSWFIDETSYIDHDVSQTSVYSDYRVTDGMLVPYMEIDSNGDHAFDVTSRVTNVVTNETIDPSVFAPLVPSVVDNNAPVTVPLDRHRGLLFTTVTIDGKAFHFLIDSGSQGNVLDLQTVKALGLHPEGTLEITGAARVASEGVVETPDLYVGSVKLPTHVASVIDLGGIVGDTHVDGVLGYPFFAAAEVRIDPDRWNMTIARPGTLAPLGSALSVDTDRELPEISASIDGQDSRFIVDTGDSNELLIFKSFIDKYPQVISWVGNSSVRSFGVGGSTNAVNAVVSDLFIGTYHLYNRYANVILASSGAFADRNDGGNIGEAVLSNFIATFDLLNHSIQLDRARSFDDGRFRTQTEKTIP